VVPTHHVKERFHATPSNNWGQVSYGKYTLRAIVPLEVRKDVPTGFAIGGVSQD
jgi:hypothetical protein